jgi:phospholipid/cholesterol/gamma-HCH transport system substrate-binding protein
MAQNTTETIIGGVVILAAAGFFFYASQAAGISGGGGGGYTLGASFRSAEGVTVGTDVRLAGVKVGTVTGLRLDPETFRAETTFSVRAGLGIPDDSAAVIASEGLLGGNFIEIVPGASLETFQPGDQIEDTQGAVSLVSLLMKFVAGNGADGAAADGPQ